MGEYAALAAAAEEDIIDGLSVTRRSSAPALAGGVGGRAYTASLSSSLSGTPSHLGQTMRRSSGGASRAVEKRKSLQTTASDSLSDSVSMLLGGRELGSENTVRGGSGDGRPTSLRLSKTSLAAIGSSTSQPRMAKRKSITFAFDFPAVPDEPVSAGSALGSPASPASPAATEAAAPSAAFPAVAFDAEAPRPASRTASDVSSTGTAAAEQHAPETLDMYPKPFSRASPARRMRFEGAGGLGTSPRRRRGEPDAGGAGKEGAEPRDDAAKESGEGDAGVALAAQAPAPAPAAAAAAVRTTGRLTHYDAAAYAQFASGERATSVGPVSLATHSPAGASVSAASPAVAAAAAATRHRLGRSPVALPLPHEVTAPLTGVDRDLHALSMVRGQRAAYALETDELHNQYYSTGSRAYYDDGHDGHDEDVETAGQPMSVALDDKADALGRAVFLLEKELHSLQARHAGALRVQQETEAAQRRLQASRDGVEIDFDDDGSRGAARAASEAGVALDMGSVRAAHAEWRACVQRAGVVLESVFGELQRQRKASMLALDGDEPRWDLARLESRLIAAQAKLDDMGLVGRGDAPYTASAAAAAAPAPETLQHSTQTAPPPTPPQPAPLPSWQAAPADAASSVPRASEAGSRQGTLRSDAMSLSATAPAPFPTPLTSAEMTATAPAPSTAAEPAPGAAYPIGGRPLRAATSFVEGFSYSTPSRRLRYAPAAVTASGAAAAGGVPALPAERAAAAERYHDLFYRGWAHLDGDAPAGVVFGADVPAASREDEGESKGEDNGDDVSDDFEAALERKIQNFDNLEGEDAAVGLARGFIASGAMHTSRGQPFQKNQCYVARSTDGFCRTRFAQVADSSGQFVWGGRTGEDAPHPRRDDGSKLFFMLGALAGGVGDAVRLSNLSRVRSLHPEVPHAFAFAAIETGYDVPDASDGGAAAETRQARQPSARPSYMHVASSADRGFLGASHARQSKEVKSRARPRPVTYVVQMNQREASVWTEFLGLWSDAA